MREIVKAKHVMLEFNGHDVLNISELSVAENERIGLIGANGSGKTSLLRILSGDMETATCKVIRYGNVLFVPQVSIEDSHHMVPTDYMASIWGVKNCELIHASGGEAARVRISRAFSEQATAVFLDEPTAHLDEPGKELLIKSIHSFDGAVVLVSHDREFLDRTVSKIWELKNGSLREFSGNYSAYQRQIEEARKAQELAYQKYTDEKRRLAEAAATVRKKADNLYHKKKGRPAKDADQFGGRLGGQKSIGSKEKSAYKAAGSIERRLAGLEEVERPERLPIVRFRQPEYLVVNNPYPIVAENITVSFGANTLLDNVTFRVARGAKVALTGENGVGKTTLFRMIAAHDPQIAIAQKCVIGSYEQRHEKSSSTETMLSFLMRDALCKQHEMISMLAQLGFCAADIRKELRHLSEGELNKVMLLSLLTGCYNVLLLDEPTAFLDIFSVEALERMIRDYRGTVIFITHDKTFIRNCSDCVLTIRNRGIDQTSIRGFEDSNSDC